MLYSYFVAYACSSLFSAEQPSLIFTPFITFSPNSSLTLFPFGLSLIFQAVVLAAAAEAVAHLEVAASVAAAGVEVASAELTSAVAAAAALAVAVVEAGEEACVEEPRLS